ncbi:hypothetical protein DL766_004101 [Monosporascus sp. MC13-8B]|uniref:Aminotransferase class IV n=1 Tax=Monosporascus cannonballus TaxID=155416 RepID=A0ABY0HIA2_9PEZI|nr:hypothetical protein DL762_000794 [Monosporascus cannonballus]RYO96387.1 hypothetical protein DL763_003243 [Monosporascus cannonballus]RYP32094.1 hypothetical protein DL766_004101 [Monosporascus sp. MC13-8B]
MEDFRLFTSLRYDPALIRVPDEGITDAGWNQKSSVFYMLDFHRDRLQRAAAYWDWASAIEVIAGDGGLKRLEEYLEAVIADLAGVPHRIKVELSRDGVLSHQISPVAETPLDNLFPEHLPRPGEEAPSAQTQPGRTPSKTPEYEILVDSQHTAKSEFTHYKTTRRAMYDGARVRAGLAPADRKEVLLFNHRDGSVMEGSLTTCYFWRDGKWVTPVVPREYTADRGSGGNDGTTRRWALERGLVAEQDVRASSLVDGEECWISNGVRGFMFGRVKLGK